MPDVNRWTILAMVLVAAGVVIIVVALLNGSSSSTSDDPRLSSKPSGVEPVEPINPEDVDKRPDTKVKKVDPTDPFAISFGKSARREVTLRVRGNGSVNVAVSYRDDKQSSKRVINRAYSTTRVFKGRYPMGMVAIQIPGNLPGSASRASCTIEIDGVEVSKRSTTEAGALVYCIG
jgi:hypothetical protein